MENNEILKIVDEVIDLFDETMRKELSGEYNSLDRQGVLLLLMGVRTAFYKKIARK